MAQTRTIFLLLAMVILGSTLGCSSPERYAEESSVENLAVSEPPASGTSKEGGPAADASETQDEKSIAASEIPVSIPQIAYVYSYGFRISASEIRPLQQAHADLCEKSGPNICHILNLSQSGSEGDYVTGMLEIEVVAPKAREFGEQLGNLAKSKGGEAIDTAISGEDLSKQIVDTEARLRARILLRDRLMEILQNRTGKVSELVEAERGVAAVNEEIDEAQSWLAEMKGRVNFSKITINYQSGSPAAGGFLEPIRQALGSAASMLGMTIALIISTFIFLLPWAAILIGVFWSKRRFGWRWRFWEKPTPETDWEPQP